MLLANSYLISRHPAQLYYSVLPFLPTDTYLAHQYPTHRGCISVLHGRENSWTPSLFALSGGTVAALAPGGHIIAVGREDGIHIYNASNGLLNSSIRTISSKDYIPYLAAFTEDECGVVVVSSVSGRVSYQIEKFDLVKQNGQIYRTTPRDRFYPLKLSEYGSYVAFAEHKNMDTRICIWKTDGGDDTPIPLGCAGEVLDLDLAGESAHLVAVATKDITILSIPSGGVQRTLYHEGAECVRISHDGLFLASWIRLGEARLWSVTQGTLLATFEPGSAMVLSRTNRLYVSAFPCGRIYDMSADPNSVAVKSFRRPSPLRCEVGPSPHTDVSILPTPDESRILICTSHVVEVLSLRPVTDTHAPRHDILGLTLSGDASILALATETNIEIWDARIGQRLHVIQSRTDSKDNRHVALSAQGELIASLSDDGIIPTTYSSSPQGRDSETPKLAASQLHGAQYLCVWGLPSGTLLHSLECGGRLNELRWSRTDQYLLFKPWDGTPRYLNAKTFQEEVLEHPGDRFQLPSHLYPEGNTLRIRLSSGREVPLFLALPSNLRIFSLRGDRACILSWDGRLLLLDTSDLEAYMETCDLHFGPEVSCIKLCCFFVVN